MLHFYLELAKTKATLIRARVLPSKKDLTPNMNNSMISSFQLLAAVAVGTEGLIKLAL